MVSETKSIMKRLLGKKQSILIDDFEFQDCTSFDFIQILLFASFLNCSSLTIVDL